MVQMYDAVLLCKNTKEFEELEQYADTLFQAEKRAKTLKQDLDARLSLQEKIEYLLERDDTKSFLKKHPEFAKFFESISQKVLCAFLQFIALGQAEEISPSTHELSLIGDVLLYLEEFYEPIGGLIGYHEKVLELVHRQLVHEEEDTEISYLPPPYFDIRKDTAELRQAIQKGIEMQEKIAEIYPVGGAAIDLIYVMKKQEDHFQQRFFLFVADLFFEMLFRDLQAKRISFLLQNLQKNSV